MLKSIIAAFSMYSKIPMPRIEWEKKNMRYSMCCFPLVGAVLGLISFCCFYGLDILKANDIITAVILTILPILLTGGIHMDGFLDVIDAKSSYRSREECLQILKDPHTGAFAIIYAVVYMMLCFGFWSEVTKKEIFFVAMGYVYSRILSGLSVVSFQKAREEGTAADTAALSKKSVKWILVVELMACVLAFLVIDPCYGSVCIAAGLLCFLYYRHMAYKVFGGITGDLAGYFLQICELAILFSVVCVKFFSV